MLERHICKLLSLRVTDLRTERAPSGHGLARMPEREGVLSNEDRIRGETR